MGKRDGTVSHEALSFGVATGSMEDSHARKKGVNREKGIPPRVCSEPGVTRYGLPTRWNLMPRAARRCSMRASRAMPYGVDSPVTWTSVM